MFIKNKSYNIASYSKGNLQTKKNILKSNSFDVMQTVFFAFTCKFGLVIKV